MTKIVYNACYGGFSLSDAAVVRLAELKGVTLYTENSEWGGTLHWTSPPTDAGNTGRTLFDRQPEDRADPLLIRVVEELGPAAAEKWAQLEITELPAGTKYRIAEYDGLESVMTIDDYKWSIA